MLLLLLLGLDSGLGLRLEEPATLLSCFGSKSTGVNIAALVNAATPSSAITQGQPKETLAPPAHLLNATAAKNPAASK